MLTLGVGLLFLGLIALVVLSVNGTGDYGAERAVGGDNAAPGLAALVHGDIAGYLSDQPLMGLTSILVRLPSAVLAAALRVDSLAAYQLGVLACLIPLALLAAYLAGAKDIPLNRRLYGLVGLVVLILSPILQNAVDAGHPEGILAAALATAAVIAATQGRARTAAVLLGLAIGSQDWALMAAPPVVIASRGRRREVVLLAGAVASLMTVSVWLADPSGFLRAFHGETATRYVTPLSILWPVSIPLHLPDASVEWVRAMPLGMRRPEATLVSVGLVGMIGGACYLRVRRRVVGFEPLALLALLGLLRCVCDSTHEEYYGIASLIPVIAWEVSENRLALIGTLMSVRAWATYELIGHISATDLYLSSLGMKVLLVGYFARRAVVLAPRPATAIASPVGETIDALWPLPADRTIAAVAEAEPIRA